MYKSKVSQAISLALIVNSGFLVSGVNAADESAQEEQKIVITGSRIKRFEVEGSSPLTVISREDMEKQGFTTAFEALSSLNQFTGSIQDDQFSGGFTQAANSLNLRNMGPGRTLVLLNGRRVADYPLPFNSESNMVNLGNIPSVLIDRIELLSSGASAVYGSDAIAGVINIILRKDVDENQLSVRVGDTTQGGGESARIQFAGGLTKGDLDFNYGVELFKREPIWGYERDYLAESNESTPTFLLLDPYDDDANGLVAEFPSGFNCSQLGQLVNGTTQQIDLALGSYCGSTADAGLSTIRNGKENASVYTNWNYAFSSDHNLIGHLIYTDAQTELNTGTTSWSYRGLAVIPTDFNRLLQIGDYYFNNVFVNTSTAANRWENWTRVFSPEEMGGLEANNSKFDETSISFAIGFDGYLGDNFEYDTAYYRSEYETTRTRRLVVDQLAKDLFLGQPVGFFPAGQAFGIGTDEVVLEYFADPTRLFTPLTQEEYQQITAENVTTANSKSETVNFTVTGDLVDMTHGWLAMAALVEYGRQSYEIDVDPGVAQGIYYGQTGTSGAGERDRYAVGVEFSVPLLASLTATTAIRYDKYDDITEVDDAVTYNLGLEWRPVDGFLARASAATSFRAPDMHFVFAGPTGYYLGDLPGYSEGNPSLKEEEGKSMTLGFVWDAIENGSLTVDYYRIELDDAVVDRSAQEIVDTVIACQAGELDPNSPTCGDAESRLAVNNFGEIVGIRTNPINATRREVSGIDASFKYSLLTSNWGNFAFNMGYTHVLEEKFQQFEQDELLDVRDLPFNDNFRSRFRASTTWDIADFSTTLLAVRTGSIPKFEGEGRCCTQVIYNLSTQYTLNNDWTFGLYVQNLLDTDPTHDSTYTDYPYYSISNFNPYGREVFLQVDYRF